MKRASLEMYLNTNLGDDIFLRMIAERYDNVDFYINAGSNYVPLKDLKNVHGRSTIRKIIDKCASKFFGGPKWYGKKFATEVVLGGSMFIEQKKTRKELEKEIKNKYRTDLSLFILGANFGPYKNGFYFKEHEKVFKNAKDICFREKYSGELFKKLENVRVAPDIVFGLNQDSYKATQEKKVVISVIDLSAREKLKAFLNDYENKIIEIAKKYAKNGYKVVLMSFCKAEGDELAIERIMSKISDKNIASYRYKGDIMEALKQISSSEIVIGTRFHSVVLGLVFKKKVLPIIYSNKTRNMLKDIGFSGRIVEIDEMSNMSFDDINSGLVYYKGIEKLREDAERHFEKLDEFLGRN